MSDTKKIIEQKNGYRIIKRGEVNTQKNISCLVCECIIIDEIDEISINRSGCCFDCENEVVDANRKKWLEGWRPDSNLVKEIKSLRLNSPHSRSPI